MNTMPSLSHLSSLKLIDQIIDESATALKAEAYKYLPKFQQTIQSLVQSLNRSDQRIELVVSKLESRIQVLTHDPKASIIQEVFRIRKIVDTLFQILQPSMKCHPKIYKDISVEQFIQHNDDQAIWLLCTSRQLSIPAMVHLFNWATEASSWCVINQFLKLGSNITSEQLHTAVNKALEQNNFGLIADRVIVRHWPRLNKETKEKIKNWGTSPLPFLPPLKPPSDVEIYQAFIDSAHEFLTSHEISFPPFSLCTETEEQKMEECKKHIEDLLPLIPESIKKEPSIDGMNLLEIWDALKKGSIDLQTLYQKSLSYKPSHKAESDDDEKEVTPSFIAWKNVISVGTLEQIRSCPAASKPLDLTQEQQKELIFIVTQRDQREILLFVLETFISNYLPFLDCIKDFLKSNNWAAAKLLMEAPTFQHLSLNMYLEIQEPLLNSGPQDLLQIVTARVQNALS